MAAIVPAAALGAFHRNDDAGAFVGRCWQDFEVVTASGVIAGLLFTQGQRVESLHIHPQYSGSCHGTLLLDYAQCKIAAHSPRAELDVLAGNTRARDFYRSPGWFDVRHFSGFESGQTPVPMVLMGKDLRAIAY